MARRLVLALLLIALPAGAARGPRLPKPKRGFQMHTSHQHRLGTYVSASLEQPDGNFLQVFENHDWEHPRELWTHQQAPWKDQDPPIIRLARGQRMRFTCRWQNTDTKRVTFGVETTDEMCFVTGYFYRDDETSPPISGAGCFTVKEGLMCPLAKTLSSAE